MRRGWFFTVVLVVSSAGLLVVCQMGASSTGMVSPIAGGYLLQPEREERLLLMQPTLTKRHNNEGAHYLLSLALFAFLFFLSPPLRGFAANQDPRAHEDFVHLTENH